jgi:23S rRNA (uracil1939-C5)-methyltransferase
MAQTNAKTALKLEAEIVIDALAYGPYGIGRLDGKAVMIPDTAPGDKIVARVVESKERYAVGEIIRLIEPSPLRQIPPCPYVGRCGGCSWQHLRYQAQLKAKEQSVADALQRIGKLSDFELRPIMSANEYHYRRRIRLQVDGSKRLGFYGAGSHDLVEIDSCLIAAAPLNRALEPLRRWLISVAGCCWPGPSRRPRSSSIVLVRRWCVSTTRHPRRAFRRGIRPPPSCSTAGWH